jgi:hypothetical protein
MTNSKGDNMLTLVAGGMPAAAREGSARPPSSSRLLDWQADQTAGSVHARIAVNFSRGAVQ